MNKGTIINETNFHELRSNDQLENVDISKVLEVEVKSVDDKGFRFWVINGAWDGYYNPFKKQMTVLYTKSVIDDFQFKFDFRPQDYDDKDVVPF